MERYLPQFKWWSSWHIQLKPWYDAYGGPYKDKYHFWTGLLLLARCLLVITVTVNNDGKINLDILMWLCLILIPLVALIKVYKSFVLNVLEIVCFLCILAMVHSLTAEYDVEYYAVFGVFLCLLIYSHLVLPHGSMAKVNTSTEFLHQVMGLKKNMSADEEASVLSKNAEQEGKSLSTSNLTTVCYNELCEPLLEDNYF